MCEFFVQVGEDYYGTMYEHVRCCQNSDMHPNSHSEDLLQIDGCAVNGECSGVNVVIPQTTPHWMWPIYIYIYITLNC